MYTYLVVDDEELIRKGTIKKISSVNPNLTLVGEAANGEEAVTIIEQLHPDITILDMQMPIMDGMELLPYLAEHYPEMPLIVISGYRDFEFIKQAISSNAIEYLLKPFSKETIAECLKKATDILDSKSALHSQIENSESEKEQACFDYDSRLLSDLIMGHNNSSVNLTSKRLNFINDNLSFSLITLYFPQERCEKAIDSILKDNGYFDFSVYLNSTDSDHLGFIIAFLPDLHSSNKKYIIGILEAISSNVPSGSISFAAVSSFFRKVENLSEAYGECVNTFDSCTPEILRSGDFSYAFFKEEHSPVQIVWDKTAEFLFRIEAGMENEVSELTSDLFAFYDSYTGLTIADIKYHLYHLTDSCNDILVYYLKNQTAPKQSKSMLSIISNSFSLEELRCYYSQYFSNISLMIKPLSIYSTEEDIIKKIITYIDRNYMNPINQEFLSSLFYINRSYLSTLFKERTGENFIDYLNSIRIEKAKTLLSETDKKMYSVSHSVGYDNVKYFFRIFKKKTGYTPEQYRARAKK